MNIILIILAGAVGFFIGRAVGGNSASHFETLPREEMEEIREASREALGARTKERKEKILAMMENAFERHEELKACGIEKERKGINRADVEELFGVTGQTALVYLNELEQEGKIRQIGLVGKNVYYMLA